MWRQIHKFVQRVISKEGSVNYKWIRKILTKILDLIFKDTNMSYCAIVVPQSLL